MERRSCGRSTRRSLGRKSAMSARSSPASSRRAWRKRKMRRRRSRSPTRHCRRSRRRSTLYAGAGGAVSPRRDLAAVLGVPPEQARVVMQDVGGNFGTRGSFNAEFALVAWAAKRLGRPVKWTSDRQEYFVADHQARDLAVTAELALDREGQFLAMRGSNLVNQGAYALAFGPLNKGVE